MGSQQDSLGDAVGNRLPQRRPRHSTQFTDELPDTLDSGLAKTKRQPFVLTNDTTKMVVRSKSFESTAPEARSELPARLGKNLAACRKSLDLTQAQVAERLGVDTETLSRFERGKHVPSLITLEKLAAVLGSTVADLLDEDPELPASDTTVMASWLSGLSPQDQKFARQMLKACCDHLAAKKTS